MSLSIFGRRHRGDVTRRVALAACVGGAALASLPAGASAASACSYDSVTKRVSVFDGSGAVPLRIVRSGTRIAAADGTGTPTLCGAGDIFNTSKIIVSGQATQSANDGFWVDTHNGEFGPGAVAETDGKSEIEVLITNFGARAQLWYFGTNGGDIIKAAGLDSVMVGNDADIDVDVSPGGGSTALPVYQILISGGLGNDFISGRGNAPSSPGASRVALTLNGDAGNDTLVDGLSASSSSESLYGGADDDFLYSVDGVRDINVGGEGTDRASVDSLDTENFGIETVQKTTIGRLKMSRAVVKARAGGVAQLQMGWTHPKAWRELSKVEVLVYRGTRPAATFTMNPRSERIRGQGSLRLVANDSSISHRGKTVTARLAVRLPKRLAGESLRIDVEATDRKGKRQLEPGAGLIKIK